LEGKWAPEVSVPDSILIEIQGELRTMRPLEISRRRVGC
jgi:hypothetical protein